MFRFARNHLQAKLQSLDMVHLSTQYDLLYRVIVEKNEMGRTCGAYGGGKRVHRVLVGKREGKRPLGRPRRRWEDNIKMDV
jgi:hypothetical protein